MEALNKKVHSVTVVVLLLAVIPIMINPSHEENQNKPYGGTLRVGFSGSMPDSLNPLIDYKSAMSATAMLI